MSLYDEQAARSLEFDESDLVMVGDELEEGEEDSVEDEEDEEDEEDVRRYGQMLRANTSFQLSGREDGLLSGDERQASAAVPIPRLGTPPRSPRRRSDSIESVDENYIDATVGSATQTFMDDNTMRSAVGSSKDNDEDRSSTGSEQQSNSPDAGIGGPGGLPTSRSTSRSRGSVSPPFTSEEETTDPKIVIGICAMDKKTRSKPMQEMIRRLSKVFFDVIIFGNDCIFNKSIDEWPQCDALMSWESGTFPLDKAVSYAQKYKPYLLNDLEKQYWLHDRRKVYSILQKHGIPVPEHVIVNRSEARELAVGDAVRVLNTSTTSACNTLTKGKITKLREDGIATVELDWLMANDSKAFVCCHTSRLEEGTTEFIEAEDFIQVGSTVVHKPFVEKPVDANDHNVCVYYPMASGGGSKRLFRKINDKSSEFDEDVNNVRRNGSYIYEHFLQTDGTDVKVYCAGPNYAHAEARKSPVVDGKVLRDVNGKEVRFPVLLTVKEKEIARKVVLAFGQSICGFDLLRTDHGSVVCDVNGWSFVKSSNKYWDDCSFIASNMIMHALQKKRPQLFRKWLSENRAVLGLDRGRSIRLRRPRSQRSLASSPMPTMCRRDSDPPSPNRSRTNSGSSQLGLITEDPPICCDELVCMLAIFRHADRTPKSKLKAVVHHQYFVDFFEMYRNKKGKGGEKSEPDPNCHEIKMKSPKDLQRFLDVVRNVMTSLNMKRSKVRDPDDELLSSEDEDDDEYEDDTLNTLRRIESVLTMYGNRFRGINRKVQMKVYSTSIDPSTNKEVIREVQVIVKWGGVLTTLGASQAKEVGHLTRSTSYPGASLGFLRLHSTYRHDLKIYMSDEGRVQMTAAAFTKEFLQLDGPLPPILVSLCRRAPDMLDTIAKEGRKQMDACKKKIAEFFNNKEPIDIDEFRAKFMPTADDRSDMVAAARATHSTYESLKSLYKIIRDLTAYLRTKIKRAASGFKPPPSSDVSGSDSDSSISSGFGSRGHARTDSSISQRSSRSSSPTKGGSVPEGQVAYEARCEGVGPDKADSLQLISVRWRKIENDLFKKKKQTFDLSKIADIYDCVVYDLLHNAKHVEPFASQIYKAVKPLATLVVPQEFGLSKTEKISIGKTICKNLILKIIADLKSAKTNTTKDRHALLNPSALTRDQINTPGRNVRTRLYFTSESHIISLLNCIVYGATPQGERLIPSAEGRAFLSNQTTPAYLSQIIFRLYECAAPIKNRGQDVSMSSRYRLEIRYSGGAKFIPDPAGQCRHTTHLQHRTTVSNITLPTALRVLSHLAGVQQPEKPKKDKKKDKLPPIHRAKQ